MAGDYFINIAPNSKACMDIVCLLNEKQIKNCIITNDNYKANDEFSSMYIMFNDLSEMENKKTMKLGTEEIVAKETSKYLAECLNKAGFYKTIDNIACVQTNFLNVEDAIDDLEFCIRFTKIIDGKEALNVKEFLKNKLQTNNKLRNIYEKKDFMFFAKMKNFNIARNELIDNIKKHNTWIKSYSIPKIYRVDRSGIPEKNITLYGQYCEMSI